MSMAHLTIAIDMSFLPFLKQVLEWLSHFKKGISRVDSTHLQSCDALLARSVWIWLKRIRIEGATATETIKKEAGQILKMGSFVASHSSHAFRLFLSGDPPTRIYRLLMLTQSGLGIPAF